MPTKHKATLAKADAPLAGVRMLEHELIRQMMKLYRADHPDSKETDDVLYERLRRKLMRAFQRLEFNALDNLPTARALLLAMHGQTEKGAALLEEHYQQQQLVGQGRIHGNRSKAGNEAQAAARLEALPDGHPLKDAHQIAERDRLIRKHADRLRDAHPNLKPPDIRRRVATWAAMSEKQIKRILSLSQSIN